MRGFFKDVQLFIARGNVLDLAVAVVLGAAFGSITISLVDDVNTPPIGYLIAAGLIFRIWYCASTVKS